MSGSLTSAAFVLARIAVSSKTCPALRSPGRFAQATNDSASVALPNNFTTDLFIVPFCAGRPLCTRSKQGRLLSYKRHEGTPFLRELSVHAKHGRIFHEGLTPRVRGPGAGDIFWK